MKVAALLVAGMVAGAAPAPTPAPPHAVVALSPFDCGRAFCTLPVQGWVNVLRRLKDQDEENDQLRARVLELEARRCGAREG